MDALGMIKYKKAQKFFFLKMLQRNSYSKSTIQNQLLEINRKKRKGYGVLSSSGYLQFFY